VTTAIVMDLMWSHLFRIKVLIPKMMPYKGQIALPILLNSM